MNKIFFVFLFVVIFTTDSFASGIASGNVSAPCTNSTLETYSGNSNLAADWQPNEINLRWYNGNTLMDVQSSANTCVYDGTLAVPSTAPTRTGYTFAGWTVRSEVDFGTIPAGPTENGTERWAIGSEWCFYDTDTRDNWNTVPCNSDNNFSELQRYEWKVKFNHGYLYGMSGCSATIGTAGEPGTPIIGSGVYCWCKATGYKATNSDIISRPARTLSWVHAVTHTTNDACSSRCVSFCSDYVETWYIFRNALFAPAN